MSIYCENLYKPWCSLQILDDCFRKAGIFILFKRRSFYISIHQSKIWAWELGTGWQSSTNKAQQQKVTEIKNTHTIKEIISENG